MRYYRYRIPSDIAYAPNHALLISIDHCHVTTMPGLVCCCRCIWSVLVGNAKKKTCILTARAPHVSICFLDFSYFRLRNSVAFALVSETSKNARSVTSAHLQYDSNQKPTGSCRLGRFQDTFSVLGILRQRKIRLSAVSWRNMWNVGAPLSSSWRGWQLSKLDSHR